MRRCKFRMRLCGQLTTYTVVICARYSVTSALHSKLRLRVCGQLTISAVLAPFFSYSSWRQGARCDVRYVCGRAAKLHFTLWLLL